MLRGTWAVVVAAVLSAPAPAEADFVAAQDSFTYSDGGGGVPVTLNGQNGGTGWGGAWTAQGTSLLAVVNPGASLAVTNTPFGPVSGGNRALQITGNNDALATRLLSEPTSSDVQVSFLFRFNGTVGRNDFLAVFFANGNNLSTGPNIGLKGDQDTANPSANDLYVRTSGSAGSGATIGYLENIVPGEDYLLVGTLKKSGSTTYNRFEFQVYDDLGGPVGSVVATGNTGLSAIDRVGLRAANLDGGVNVQIDELRVAAVPAPAGGLLAACGGACLLVARRLRRKAV